MISLLNWAGRFGTGVGICRDPSSHPFMILLESAIPDQSRVDYLPYRPWRDVQRILVFVWVEFFLILFLVEFIGKQLIAFLDIKQFPVEPHGTLTARQGCTFFCFFCLLIYLFFPVKKI